MCMCDVSSTYLWRLHDDCVAFYYANDQNHMAFNHIRSAMDKKSTAYVCGDKALYMEHTVYLE